MVLRIAAPSALILLAWLAQPAAAQNPAGTAGPATAAPASQATTGQKAATDRAADHRVANGPDTPSSDTSSAKTLSVDLARLQRRLQNSAELEASGASRIRFDVSVYAAAPRIQILSPSDNLRYGQPRRSAPTHQDMMDIVTPQPFRHMPGMGLGSIVNWLQGDKR